MAKFFWSEDRPPRLREYPWLLAKAILAGAVFGIVFSLGGSLLFERPISKLMQELPLRLLYSAYVGAAFNLSFYFFGGLPWPYVRPIIKDYPPGLKRVIVAAVGALSAMLAFTISAGLVSLIPSIHLMGMEHFGSILLIEAIVGAILALIIGAFKTLQRNFRSAEAQLHERKIRESALSEAASRAQACALQAQINPHFFFNTLNTLSALIPINQAAAQDIVGRLADMFRYTLACSCSELVTLTQELAFVENYLKLEQARFSSRLQLTFPAGQFDDIHLPGLSLQPLVENAIRHGIAKRIEGGNVEIAVHRNGTQCAIEVVNPIETTSETREFFREGHALANVRDRLALYAGQAASVQVQQNHPGHIHVSLILPLEKRA